MTTLFLITTRSEDVDRSVRQTTAKFARRTNATMKSIHLTVSSVLSALTKAAVCQSPNIVLFIQTRKAA